jgi:hypothetical protein
VERAVFVATLHRIFVSGSDRDCGSWMEDYDIPGAEGLDLHHSTAPWPGEEMEEKSEDALASRRSFRRVRGYDEPLVLWRGRRDARASRKTGVIGAVVIQSVRRCGENRDGSAARFVGS